jgi:hypothetical protein
MMTTSTRRISLDLFELEHLTQKLTSEEVFSGETDIFRHKNSLWCWILFFCTCPKKRHYANNSSENFCFCFHPWISFGHVLHFSRFSTSHLWEIDSNRANSKELFSLQIYPQKELQIENYNRIWNSEKQSSGERALLHIQIITNDTTLRHLEL